MLRTCENEKSDVFLKNYVFLKKSADHPPDPKRVPGLKPYVYTAYRSTPLGEALDTVLEEFHRNYKKRLEKNLMKQLLDISIKFRLLNAQLKVQLLISNLFIIFIIFS